NIENDLRRLKGERLESWGNPIYIPPQAKASLQAPDDAVFPLMENVKEFLSSERQVLLLLGDSGAGKSMFNQAPEYNLWKSYMKGESRIPLFIHLPTIDKPEHDLIEKHLSRCNFSEAQVREMKQHREFVLICDGYDEIHQERNL